MIPSVWPNVLLGLVFLYCVFRFVMWVEPWSPTPAEAARERGDLIYDEEAGEFVDVSEDDG